MCSGCWTADEMWRRPGEQLPCRVRWRRVPSAHDGRASLGILHHRIQVQDARTTECTELGNPLGAMRPLNGPHGVRSLMVIGKDDLGWTEVLEVEGTA